MKVHFLKQTFRILRSTLVLIEHCSNVRKVTYKVNNNKKNDGRLFYNRTQALSVIKNIVEMNFTSKNEDYSCKSLNQLNETKHIFKNTEIHVNNTILLFG